MKIALGSDHRGRTVKAEVISLLKGIKIPFNDFGSYDQEPVDYPDIARLVGEAVASGEYQRGILVCGTGIGVCIAANKIKGIRAATCYQDSTLERDIVVKRGVRTALLLLVGLFWR